MAACCTRTRTRPPTLSTNRLSLHPATIRQASNLEERAAVARAAGFRAWGMRGAEMDRLEDLAALMHRHSLVASDAGALNDWQWTGHPPLVNHTIPPQGSDEAALWQAVDSFFARCAALGVPTVVAVGAGQEAGTVDDAAAGLRAIGRRAASYHLAVAYEVLGTARALSSYVDGWELIRRTAADNVGLLLDCFHFHRGGTALDLLEAIPIDHILLVRLSDAPPGPRESLSGAERLMPGEGAIPLREMARLLESRGYGGYYSVEVVNPAYQSRPPLDVAREAYARAVEVLAP